MGLNEHSCRRRCFQTIWVACFVLLGSRGVAAEWALFRISIDGSGLERISHQSDRYCGSPDWSPDGKWIAYDTWSTQGVYSDSQVCLISADGKESKVLGPGAMPSWSPDGTQIVCHTYDSPQTIIVMNADGTGRETILNHWGSPCWSPKHDRIASLGARNRTIHLFDLRTGKESVMLPGNQSIEMGFSISPDGSGFCFGDSRGGVAIATLNEDTHETDLKWLTKEGMTSHTSWSPDGKRVVYHWGEERDDTTQLYMQDVDSDAPRQRLAWQDPMRPYSSPDWSPDGKSIVFCSVTEVESP